MAYLDTLILQRLSVIHSDKDVDTFYRQLVGSLIHGHRLLCGIYSQSAFLCLPLFLEDKNTDQHPIYITNLFPLFLGFIM